jgi:tRNA nucleotidyltransferase (CCA-adding enzyme)
MYLGLLLRDKCVHNPNTGSHWATSVLFSLLQELVPMYDAVEDQLDGAI